MTIVMTDRGTKWHAADEADNAVCEPNTGLAFTVRVADGLPNCLRCINRLVAEALAESEALA